MPQAAYNPVYGTNVPDSLGTDLSRIADYQLTFKPIADANPDSGPATLEQTAVTLDMSPKNHHRRLDHELGTDERAAGY